MILSVSIDDTRLKRELRRLKKKVVQFQNALEEITDEIEEAIELAFTQKKSSDNKAWKDWSETTKKRWGTDGSLLNRTGRLKKSIKVSKKEGEVSIEVRHPGAATHQFGFPKNKAWGRGKAPIPKRPYLPIKTINNLTPAMLKRVEQILEKYFDVE